MILKLRTMDSGWVFFPFDGRIKERELSEIQYKNGCDSNVPDRREVSIENLNGQSYSVYDGKLKVIRFENPKKVNADFVIYTNLSVYLLNDEGKTIEKIN